MQPGVLRWLGFQVSWLLTALLMVLVGGPWWLCALLVVGALAIWPRPASYPSTADASVKWALATGAAIIGLGAAIGAILYSLF